MSHSLTCILILTALSVTGNAQDLEKSFGSKIASLFSSGSSRLDVDVDGLFSSDIDITKSTVRFEQQIDDWTLNGSFGLTIHDVDYSPAPGTFTLPAKLNEETYEYSLGIEKSLNRNLSFSMTARYVNGFSDHRSLWISEFNQQFLGGLPSFKGANPQSYSLSLGSQWDYQPGRKKLSFTFAFSSALVVPGNSIDPVTFIDAIHSEEELDTFSGSILWETVVNPRLRAQQSLRMTQTENREFRTQVQSEWALALANNFVLRANVGATNEDPSFESIYGGLTVIYELGANWQFDLGARYYEDTGEITTANFNTAAPGLKSTELSLGVLWRNGTTSVRASVALYDTNFDPITNPENLVFSNLYQDREFIAARLAVTYTF